MSVVAFTPRKPTFDAVRADILSAGHDHPRWFLTADAADDGMPSVSIQRSEEEFAAFSAHWDERGWAVLYHGDTLEVVTRSPDLRQALSSALA